MNAQTKRSLITQGAGLLGGIGGMAVGIPPWLGSAAGSTLAAGVTQGMQDPVQKDNYFVHTDPGPNAYYSAGKNQRPMFKTRTRGPKQIGFDNAMQAMTPFMGLLSSYGFDALGKAVPSAREGTFLPAHLPSHEQGGVPIVDKNTGQQVAEAEGNEYMIPGGHVDEIMSGNDYAEIGKRFVNEVGRLQEKGMNDFMAEDGLKFGNLFSPYNQNSYADFNANRAIALHDPARQSPQGVFNPMNMVSPAYDAFNNMQQGQVAESPLSDGPIAPGQDIQAPPQQFDIYDDAKMGSAFDRIMGRGTKPFSFDNYKLGVNNEKDDPATLDMQDHFNSAIAAQEEAAQRNRFLHTGTALANLIGLTTPFRPSQPLSMGRFKRPEYVDQSSARINQADRELGMGISLTNQFDTPVRAGLALPGLLNNYGQQRAQIAEAKGDMLNRQEDMSAQVDAQEKQAQFGVDAANKEVATAEAQMKYSRDQIGIAGIKDSITQMLADASQSKTNMAELAVIRDIMGSLKPSEQAEFYGNLRQVLGGFGININANQGV